MGKKADLILRALDLDLGTVEDFEQLSIAEMEELVGDAPAAPKKSSPAKVDPEPTGYVRKNPNMTMVEDCIGLGTMKVGGAK